MFPQAENQHRVADTFEHFEFFLGPEVAKITAEMLGATEAASSQSFVGVDQPVSGEQCEVSSLIQQTQRMAKRPFRGEESNWDTEFGVEIMKTALIEHLFYQNNEGEKFC